MLSADGQGGPDESDGPSPTEQPRLGVGEPDPPPGGAAAGAAPPAADVRGDTEMLRALLRQARERGLSPEEEQALAELERALRRLLDVPDDR